VGPQLKKNQPQMEYSVFEENFSNCQDKETSDTALVKHLKQYFKINGYISGMATHRLLSSIISRAEAKGEQWTRFYPDDETYDDATENIIIQSTDGYESEVEQVDDPMEQ
jgi:hypothetical protein